MELNKPIYYECHITIEPIFDEKLEQIKILCSKYQFKVADLLMQKRKEDLPTRSGKDTFCTGKSKNYTSLFEKMNLLLEDLKINEYKICRYKIEAILLDIKTIP